MPHHYLTTASPLSRHCLTTALPLHHPCLSHCFTAASPCLTPALSLPHSYLDLSCLTNVPSLTRLYLISPSSLPRPCRTAASLQPGRCLIPASLLPHHRLTRLVDPCLIFGLSCCAIYVRTLVSRHVNFFIGICYSDFLRSNLIIYKYYYF